VRPSDTGPLRSRDPWCQHDRSAVGVGQGRGSRHCSSRSTPSVDQAVTIPFKKLPDWALRPSVLEGSPCCPGRGRVTGRNGRAEGCCSLAGSQSLAVDAVEIARNICAQRKFSSHRAFAVSGVRSPGHSIGRDGIDLGRHRSEATAWCSSPCMYQGHQVMRSSYPTPGPWYCRLWDSCETVL